jgi:hypothetical protein
MRVVERCGARLRLRARVAAEATRHNQCSVPENSYWETRVNDRAVRNGREAHRPLPTMRPPQAARDNMQPWAGWTMIQQNRLLASD